MDTAPARSLTPTRIAGLALVALAVAALGWLRFGPDSARLSVPSGAHAGQLVLKSCTYPTEDGGYKADCGTLVVPENRHDPHSRLIALPVKRIRAHTAHPGTPIFRLEGGPGLTNMSFPQASRYAGARDVVLVGYRGVDGSVRLDCPEVSSALKHSSDFLARSSLDAYAKAFRSCASRLQADGVDLAGYSLPQRADDLEAARRALGYPRVDLLSESAGTRTAMIYAQRHPRSVERSVMVGANPPGGYVWNPRITDQQIGKYSALCAQEADCSDRTDDLAATLRTTAIPDDWWFLPIKSGNVRLASFFGLMNATSAGDPISGPMTLRTWLAASGGDPSGFWFMSLLAQVVFPDVYVWGDSAAVSRMDVAAAGRFFTPGAQMRSILGDPGSEFLWAGGRLRDAWPAGPDDNAYAKLHTMRQPTLLISGDLDVATPPQRAKLLLPFLPNGHQVVLRNLGHTDDFWKHEAAAGTHLITTYLDSGTVDASRYTGAPVDFSPGVNDTSIAKWIAIVLVGLPLLVLVSLTRMARRVRRRGDLGRISSAAARTIGAPVLGIGGWLGGALLALVTMPTVPLDDEVLAVLSVGLPLALGTYLAWVRRDQARSVQAIGLAAAFSGALVGGWLGFNALGGLLGVLTAVLGATAGGNLTLIALDIAWDRTARERAADPAAPPALASAQA